MALRAATHCHRGNGSVILQGRQGTFFRRRIFLLGLHGMSTFDRAQVLASILESNRHREERGATPMNVERELHWREVLHNEAEQEERDRPFEAYLVANDALYRRVFRRAVTRRHGRSDIHITSLEGMGLQSCCRSLFHRKFKRLWAAADQSCQNFLNRSGDSSV